MRVKAETKPCEFCGQSVTKTKTQQSQRRYWTCNSSCANKLRIRLGNTPAWQENPLRGQKATRPCAGCGEPVTRYLSQRRLELVWTCSRACKARREIGERQAAGTYVQPRKLRRGLLVPCEQCGVEFYRQAKEIRRYCSRSCSDAAKTKTPVIKACGFCGKEMRLKPSQAGLIYCSRRCMGLGKTKRPLNRMHNGKPAKADDQGYVMLWEPAHPNKSMKGWQYEHRLVAEAALGRYLTSEEHVDHINEIKNDNRPGNLQVLSPADHSAKTVADLWRGINNTRDRLAEYERRFGPLEKET